MGAYCNGNVSLSPSYDVASAEDPRFCKHVHDNVHGNIYLDSLSLKFIDTEQFQRHASRVETTRYCLEFVYLMKELKLESGPRFSIVVAGAVLLPSLTLRDIIGKCGSCGCKCGSCGCNCGCGFTNMVYPGAVHSRFEHSLGVYWLASQCVEKLKTYQGLELGIDRFDIQTVKLAGLLHDVGHGPFSHLFEREFLPQVISGSDWSHEQMSVDMVDYIVDEHHIDVYPQMIRRVKEMILASSEYAPSMSSSEKSFLYDIVANGRNGIDVDKFDYLLRDCRACGLGCNFEFQRLLETMRVLDDEICYRAKDYLTIHKMFATRADLYRTVYTHPKVKAIELMVVDALVHANSYLGISSNIHDPSEYWKFCNEYPVPKDMLDNYKKVTAQDIVCSQKSGGVTLKEEDVAVCNVKIDLTRGKHNPLESIHFFKDYESDEKFTIPDDRVSHLLPTSYQDMIVKVYAKKPELVEAISEAFENFQLKTYGIKTQAHSTPQKKRRYNSFI
ncbi:Deoxynucleoside triphosphate triphosphohydrolase SAMHD1 [Glycine soja]